MNNLDVYLKSRHDFVNDFQLLYTYKQLGKEDKVNLIIESMYNQLRNEQVFFNAPCRKFTKIVFEHKILMSGSKWTFEIDGTHQQKYLKNLEKADNILYDIYQKWINFFVQNQEEFHMSISLVVEDEFVSLNILAQNLESIDSKMFNEFDTYNFEILNFDNDVLEIEFFIKLNEQEV